MSKNLPILGIDIRDGLVCALLAAPGNRGCQVLAEAHAAVSTPDTLPEALAGLLGSMDLPQRLRCRVGLSAASAMWRNLGLPFHDPRQIEQTLPLELEDSIIGRMEDQVVDHLVVERGGDGAAVVAALVERQTVALLLGLLEHLRLDPEVVTLGPVPLGLRVAAMQPEEDILLVDAGHHAAVLMLCRQGRVILWRRIGYRDFIPLPDTPATPDGSAPPPPPPPPGAAVEEDGETAGSGRIDPAAAALGSGAGEEALRGVARDIRAGLAQALEFIESTAPPRPGLHNLLLTGPLALDPGLVPALEAAFAGARFHLLDPAAAWGADGLAGTGLLHARGLALVLARDAGDLGLNFRKGEFAPAGGFPALKGRVALASCAAVLVLGLSIGWLAWDYQNLKARRDRLEEEIRTLFRQTFPGVTRIVDPLQQMRARVDELQSPDTVLPMTGAGRRVLAILADISSRIPDTVSIKVRRLVIDPESVQLKGVTDTYATVENIRNLLAASPLYEEVSTVTATARKEDGKIRFQMRLALRRDG